MISKQSYSPELSQKLQLLLDKNRDKRLIVVGTTCTGKSTFLNDIKEAQDMDVLVFPLLTSEEKDYVTQSPWTPEIGRTMTRLVKEKVKVKIGEPIFGTVVLDSDLVVYLRISDGLLGQRTSQRGANFIDAKNMQQQIEDEIKKSKIPVVEFLVG